MFESSTPDTVIIAQNNLDEISKHLEISPISMKKTLLEISGDPHAALLFEFWQTDAFVTCTDHMSATQQPAKP
jgi:hypothetical protein